jgi:D-tyrosyl-tRNA(Tyr) deacylase
MRAVVQRVTSASVTVGGNVVGRIGPGLLVFVGFTHGDTAADVDYIGSKIRDLRIFPDDNDKMNRSIVETGGAVLVVSQFTLFADCRRGRRPAVAATRSRAALARPRRSSLAIECKRRRAVLRRCGRAAGCGSALRHAGGKAARTGTRGCHRRVPGAHGCRAGE